MSRSLSIVVLLLAAGSALASADAERRSPVVEAVERVGPAVVNVSTTQVVERDVAPFPRFRDPFFDEFFRDFSEPQHQRFTRTSLGSGLIVRPDGHILTNQHVVLQASRITVTLADGREFDARLVGSDADSDLAVLKVDSDDPLPSVDMGTSNDLMIGETVIAIGNPFGLSHTVTSGVVSATGRSLQTEDQSYDDLIQTDASINPGNSGGPLLNIRGEVVGINTAIYQKAQGIGFAIPIDRAHRVVTDLISYGEVQPAWVGILVQELTPDLARHFAAGQRTGVLVRAIEAGSPAAASDLQPGDLITAINGRPVTTVGQWQSRLHEHPPGTVLIFAVTHDNHDRSIQVTTRKYPPERVDELAWQQLGLRVSERRGHLEVSAVRPRSSAAEIGIHSGDLIVAIAGSPVRSLDEFRTKLISVRQAQRVLVSVQRGRNVYHVPMVLGGAL